MQKLYYFVSQHLHYCWVGCLTLSKKYRLAYFYIIIGYNVSGLVDRNVSQYLPLWNCLRIQLLTPIAYCYRVVQRNERTLLDKENLNKVVLFSLRFLCQTKDHKNWYSQLPCLTFSIKKDSVKPPPCLVDRWAGGNLTRKTNHTWCSLCKDSKQIS